MGANAIILFWILVSETQLTRVSEHWINKNERLISFSIGTTDISYTVQRNKHIDGDVPVLVGRNEEIIDWAAQTKQQVRNIYRNRFPPFWQKVSIIGGVGVSRGYTDHHQGRGIP